MSTTRPRQDRDLHGRFIPKGAQVKQRPAAHRPAPAYVAVTVGSWLMAAVAFLVAGCTVPERSIGLFLFLIGLGAFALVLLVVDAVINRERKPLATVHTLPREGPNRGGRNAAPMTPRPAPPKAQPKAR